MSGDCDDKVPVVTEEPFPGWLRYELEGNTPYYKSPVPRTVIKSARKLSLFLESERKKGNMKDVAVSDFTFKRRLGLKKPIKELETSSISSLSESVISEGECEVQQTSEATSVIERLSRGTEVVDHRKLLSEAAKKLDSSRVSDGFYTPENFDEIKGSISTAEDLR